MLLSRIGHAEDNSPRVVWGDPPKKMHSEGLVGGGLMLSIFGALHVGLGTWAFVTEARSPNEWRNLGTIVGLPLVLTGVAMIAGGIAMVVAGARTVRDWSRPTVSFVPEMGGGALRLTF